MDLFDLFIKIKVDDQASDNVASLSSKLGNGIKTAAKIGTAAVSAAAAGVAYLTKKSVESYAEYEQLIGGVETLFKKSAGVVENYANNAYKTAGLSANEYMSTVTGFSASLLQGLSNNTSKAAEFANMAVTDMADNANKMGTDIQMIQNAYQGFAKQNYTMLDNLKLGYGGNATEMARLINQSGVLGDSIKVTSQTVKDIPFHKIVEAIHEIQTEMGITGTTAKEAASTISGSAASMKASWQNLLTGVADDTQDFGVLVDNFVDSTLVFGDNILPRVRIALTGVSRLIESVLPRAMEEIPKIINDTAPQLFKAGTNVIVTIVKGIAKNGDEIVEVIFDIFDDAADVLPDKIAKPIKKALGATEDLAVGFISFITDHGEIVIGVISGIGAAFLTWKSASAIGSAVTSIQAFVTASGKATLAQAALNAVMNANPVILLGTAIGVLVGGVVALSIAYAEAQAEASVLSERQIELMDSAAKAAESYNEMKQAAADESSAELANIEYTERLYNELMSIADANGAVKAGYESRAQFILGELNNALGTEYSMNGNIISQYSSMKSSIESVIAAKKAQILLDAQEESYRQAVQNVSEAEQARATAAIALAEAQERVSTAEGNLRNALLDNNAAYPVYLAQLNSAKDALAEQEGKYNDLSAAVMQYYTDISAYETASTMIIEGETSAAVSYLQNLGNGFRDAASVAAESAEEQKRILGEQVVATEINAQLMKQAYISGVEGVSAEMVATAAEQAETAKAEFFKVGGNITVSMADGAADSQYILNAEMQGIVDDAVSAGENTAEGAKRIGTALISGIAQGIKSGNSVIVSAAVSAVNVALAAAKREADINSPSRVWRDEIGVMMAKGLGIGFAQQMPVEAKKIMEAMDVGVFKEETENLAVSNSHKARERSSVTVYQTIHSEAKTAADLMQEAYLKQRQAVWLGV